MGEAEEEQRGGQEESGEERPQGKREGACCREKEREEQRMKEQAPDGRSFGAPPSCEARGRRSRLMARVRSTAASGTQMSSNETLQHTDGQNDQRWFLKIHRSCRKKSLYTNLGSCLPSLFVLWALELESLQQIVLPEKVPWVPSLLRTPEKHQHCWVHLQRCSWILGNRNKHTNTLQVNKNNGRYK